jgi:hypothetical protein
MRRPFVSAEKSKVINEKLLRSGINKKSHFVLDGFLREFFFI